MAQQSTSERPITAASTALIADDNPVFRSVAGIILQKDGWQTLSAGDGEEALIISRTYEGPIELLLSDVEMPRLGGYELRERILAERPGIKVLLMSATIETFDEPLLRKPFEAGELLKAVRAVLGTNPSPSSGRTVLVLEDDVSCRAVIRSILQRGGFTVIEASRSAAAMDFCSQPSQPIELMVADVLLRDPHGVHITERIRALRPNMPILFTSGYPIEHLHLSLIDSETTTASPTRFLQKPFTAGQLLDNVRTLVGE